MECQKLANLLNDDSSKSSKFRTRNWAEINDDITSAYPPNRLIRFKTEMLRSSLCDYSGAYILVEGNITVNITAAEGPAADDINKKFILKIVLHLPNAYVK